MKKFIALASVLTIAALMSTTAQAAEADRWDNNVSKVDVSKADVSKLKADRWDNTVSKVDVSKADVSKADVSKIKKGEFVDRIAPRVEVIKADKAGSRADLIGSKVESNTIGVLAVDTDTSAARTVSQGSVSGAGNPNALKK